MVKLFKSVNWSANCQLKTILVAQNFRPRSSDFWLINCKWDCFIVGWL